MFAIVLKSAVLKDSTSHLGALYKVHYEYNRGDCDLRPMAIQSLCCFELCFSILIKEDIRNCSEQRSLKVLLDSSNKIVKSFPDYVDFALTFRLSTVYLKRIFFGF